MTAPVTSVIPDDFSVHKGGPIFATARRLRLCRPGQSARLGFVLAAVTWLPLAVLVLIEGSFGQGSAIPFRNSVSTHARLLVALPLFFFAEDILDSRVPDVLRRLGLKSVLNI